LGISLRRGVELEDELTRIGISLPANLLNAFDAVISKRGYSSRSEGIRDAIRNYLIDYQSLSQEIGDQIAVITMIYDHDQKGLVSTLTDIQHRYSHIINSTIHIHIDPHNCLEVTVVRGDASKIKEFMDNMTVQHGVQHVKISSISKQKAAK
jgi:CopG family nickel-responsive transcriptional regulator